MTTACAHCDELQERVRQLEAELYGRDWDPPRELGLTLHETVILQTLMACRHTVSHWRLWDATRAAPHAWGETTEVKVMQIHVCRIRNKLRPYGLGIETVYGAGYRIPPETRAALMSWPVQKMVAEDLGLTTDTQLEKAA